MQRLKESFQQFHIVRRKIELLTDHIAETEEVDEDESEEEQAERLEAVAQAKEDWNTQIILEVEDEYCELEATLRGMMPKEAPAEIQQLPCQSRVRLPEIQLPSFSGKVNEWITFRDSFQSLIHNNQQLTAMEKFVYLQSSLMGEALQAIEPYTMSAVNYDAAWTTLESRFENKKLIVKAHLDALFAVEAVAKESFEALDRLVSDFNTNLCMLEKVGEKTGDWSTLLVHMLCSRLDSSTLRCWEMHHCSKEVPTYERLVQFLRQHCAVLQSIEPTETSVEAKPSVFGAEQSTVQHPNKCPF